MVKAKCDLFGTASIKLEGEPVVLVTEFGEIIERFCEAIAKELYWRPEEVLDMLYEIEHKFLTELED